MYITYLCISHIFFDLELKISSLVRVNLKVIPNPVTQAVIAMPYLVWQSLQALAEIIHNDL